MNTNLHDDEDSQSTATYVNERSINELFEAMMIALMVRKPDDHINFMRNCLNQVESNQNHIRWDSFVTKSSSFSIHRKQKKSLPPIIFILSSFYFSKDFRKYLLAQKGSSGGTKLCSRLLERYHRINYLLINNIANIDDDETIDLKQHEHRYQCIRNAIEERRSQATGFLIAGELDEQNFLEHWQEKLGRLDLIVILNFNLHQRITHSNFRILEIDLNNDFEDILALAIDHFDKLFSQDVLSSRTLAE